MPHLLIQNGNGVPQKHELVGDRATVGRYPDNTVVLDDGSVSGHHAEIAQADGQFTLRDLGSSNGTTVNGEAVVERVLENGDVISFGAVACRFQGQNEPATPDAASTAAPSPSEPETPPQQQKTPDSFGSKLGAFGKAAFGEAKRAAQMAALKGKIEKLKMVDLNKAHYALGKKCHELGRLRDQFGSQLEAIAELEQRIASKRENIAPIYQETTGGKIKRVAEQTKNAAEAEALALKLKQLMTALGEQVAAMEQKPVELESELHGVAEVNNRIARDETELQRLSGEKEGWNQLKGASHSLADDTGKKAKNIGAGLAGVFSSKMRRKYALAVILLVAVLVIALGSQLYLKGRTGNSRGHGNVMASPVSNGTMADAKEWARMAPNVSKAINSAHVHKIEEELNQIMESYGTRHVMTIQRRLDPNMCGYPQSYDGRLYEVVVTKTPGFQYSKRDLTTGKVLTTPFDFDLSILSSVATPSHVVLITTYTTFTSEGWATVLGRVGKPMTIKGNDGFLQELGVFEEVEQDNLIENQIVELEEYGIHINEVLQKQGGGK